MKKEMQKDLKKKEQKKGMKKRKVDTFEEKKI